MTLATTNLRKIKIITEILGNGIILFNDTNPAQSFKLKKVTQYKLGVIQTHYTKNML
jgi:hypothetical protein